MMTMTKKDLMALGYGPSHSAEIIRQAKQILIKKGHTYYMSRKMGRVPRQAVEEVLGLKLDNIEIKPCTSCENERGET